MPKQVPADSVLELNLYASKSIKGALNKRSITKKLLFEQKVPFN